MISIDQFAYFSLLRDVHPGEKFFFVGLTMVLVLALNSLAISGLVIIAITALIILAAKVDFKYYLKMLSLPLGFLLIGCATVVVNFSQDSGSFIGAIQIGNYWLGYTSQSLHTATVLFFRAMATVSCLYFLALTTPVIQIIYVLRKLRVPTIMIDLMVLIYNNIFVFFKTADSIYVAQMSRNGYNGFTNKLKCLSLLVSNLFQKSLKNTDETYNALLSRGFRGELKVLEEDYCPKRRNLAGILAFNSVLVMIYFIGRI